MKRKIFWSIAFTYFANAIIAQPNFEWLVRFGSNATEQTHCVISDKQGNVYTTGYFRNTVDFDPGLGIFNLTSIGLEDIFISKLDAAGNLIWVKQIGSSSPDEGNSIAVDDSGYVYSTGYFNLTTDFDPGPGVFNLTASNGPCYISKLNANGDFVWAKTIGNSGGNHIGYSITLDKSANIHFTGKSGGTVDFDPGPGVQNRFSNSSSFDPFVCKWDKNGNYIWAYFFGSSAQEHAYGITVDTSGNVYTTGFFNLTADFDPGLGTYNMTSFSGGATMPDVFVSKLDKNGNFKWARQLGSNSSSFADEGYDIAVDYSGNVYTSGKFGGNADFDPGAGTFMINITNSDAFISKLDSLGNFVWAFNIPGVGQDWGYSIDLDSVGNIYSTGLYGGINVDFDPGPAAYNLSGAGGGDVYICKYDPNMNLIWATDIGGSVADWGYSIDIGNNDNVYVGGSFDSTCDFDPGTPVYNVTSIGVEDAYILKLNQSIITNITSINNFDSFLSVYPNPTSDKLTIEIKKSTSISILNVLGVELLDSKIERSETIDVSFLPNGIYFVKDMNSDVCIKFIKQ